MVSADRSTEAASLEARGPVAPLERFVSLATTTVDECRLRVEPDGLRLRATDPATVAAVDLSLDESAFDRYEASGGLLGVDLERLERVLGTSAGDATVGLSLDREQGRLDVSLGDVDYALGLLDPGSVRSPPDSIAERLNGLATLTVKGETLCRGVTTAEMLSDHLTLAVDDQAGTFRVEAAGDTDEFTLERAGDDLLSFEAVEARSLYSVEYLSAVESAVEPDRSIALRLGTEQPLVAEFEFAGGTGDARFVIAPRLDSR